MSAYDWATPTTDLINVDRPGGLSYKDTVKNFIDHVATQLATRTVFALTMSIGALTNTGDTPIAGQMAIAGDYFNHCMVNLGYQRPDLNLLTETHQVSFYAGLQANVAATGAGSFLAGFETGLWGPPSGVLETVSHFQIAAVGERGTGTITRVLGLNAYWDHTPTYCSLIADYSEAWEAEGAGSWFVRQNHTSDTRPSALNGDLTVTGTLTVLGHNLVVGNGFDFKVLGNGFGMLSPNGNRAFGVATAGAVTFNYDLIATGILKIKSGQDLQILGDGFGIQASGGNRAVAVAAGGGVTLQYALILGSTLKLGVAAVISVATASTHKIAVMDNTGTTYNILATTL